jgi:hypothetical protein
MSFFEKGKIPPDLPLEKGGEIRFLPFGREGNFSIPFSECFFYFSLFRKGCFYYPLPERVVFITPFQKGVFLFPPLKKGDKGGF